MSDVTLSRAYQNRESALRRRADVGEPLLERQALGEALPAGQGGHDIAGDGGVVVGHDNLGAGHPAGEPVGIEGTLVEPDIVIVRSKDASALRGIVEQRLLAGRRHVGRLLPLAGEKHHVVLHQVRRGIPQALVGGRSRSRRGRAGEAREDVDVSTAGRRPPRTRSHRRQSAAGGIRENRRRRSRSRCRAGPLRSSVPGSRSDPSAAAFDAQGLSMSTWYTLRHLPDWTTSGSPLPVGAPSRTKWPLASVDALVTIDCGKRPEQPHCAPLGSGSGRGEFGM